MALFYAYQPIFILDFNLAPLEFLQTDFVFENNVNRVINGKTYQDIAAYEFSLGISGTYYFGGKGFSFTADGTVTGGTVTAIASYVGNIGDLSSPSFLFQGISVGATVLSAAALTQDATDDAEVLALALSGKDNLYLSSGSDYMSGFGGNDVIYGYGGSDFLFGGAGNDKLLGGADDDVLNGEAGDDLLKGNGGIDTASYQTAESAVTVDLRITAEQNTLGAGRDTLSSIERLYGSAFNDTLNGSNGNNEIVGLGGNDSLFGNGGTDTLMGFDGTDTLTGGAGKDFFRFFFAPTASDIDAITDFSHVEGDRIQIEQSNFSGITGVRGKALSSAQFYAAADATQGHDGSDRIVYNTTTGALYYDADGIGGTAAIQFATLGIGTHPALVASDIVLAI